MVEAGDTVSATLKKEFGEEAMNSLEASEERKKELESLINELFKSGTKVNPNKQQPDMRGSERETVRETADDDVIYDKIDKGMR